MTEQLNITGRPTWAEIDLDALGSNFYVIRERVGPDVKMMAAVKANAYGHGAVECARRLEAEGVDWFGVALPEEGVELRSAGITKPILCLGGFWAGQEPFCLQERLTPVVYRLELIESPLRAARHAGVVAEVHLKVDTGMGRLGVRTEALPEFCETLKRCRNIRLDGLMTHLAAADDSDREDFTRSQLDCFAQAVSIVRERGFTPTHLHGANSAAAFAFPESRGNMGRPGGALYGFVRSVLPPNIPRPPRGPVMSARSRPMILNRKDNSERLGYA